MEVKIDHELKLWPAYFEDVESDLKGFELRNNDRGFKVGQIIKFQEFKPNPTYDWDKSGYYTGRETIKKIKYILGDNNAGIETGYVILGITDTRTPPSGVQRQDSLTDQMLSVLEWANRNGCYDAALWITDNFKRKPPSGGGGV